MRLLTALLCMSAFLGSAAAQTSKPGLSPCSLVTKAEVQEATGATASDGSINKNNKAVCDFTVGDAGSVVNLSLTPKGSEDSAVRMVAELKKRKIAAEVATGFGDSAYTSSGSYGMQQLGVYKGANHVIVTVLLFGTPESKAKAVAQAIMRKALVRVP